MVTEGILVDTLRYLIKSIMGSDETHGYPHVERVERLSLWIVKHYDGSVNKELLVIATLLHDIGRFISGYEKVDHALISADFAGRILTSLGYPRDRVNLVKDIIKSHSYSLSTSPPESLEARILSDADKLDALGAIGIARVFMHSAKLNRSLSESLKHFKEKIIKLPDLMYTDIARKEALRRAKIVFEFIKNLESELKFIKEGDK